MNETEPQPPPPTLAPARPGFAPACAKPLVLVCDDEPALRELARVSLGDDYDFLEAVDGEEALELVETHRPDILILDLMLPRRSGLEVLAELRAREAAPGIVVLTAQPDFASRARDLGADVVVGKPFLPDDLAAATRELLESR